MRWFKRRGRPTVDEQWEGISEEAAAAKASRVAATADSRDLVEAISDTLFRADPVGINLGTNIDEYGSEAETIVIALPNTSGPRDVQRLVHECFVQWFDSQMAGPPARFAGLADEIWDLWQCHEAQRSSSA